MGKIGDWLITPISGPASNIRLAPLLPSSGHIFKLPNYYCHLSLILLTTSILLAPSSPSTAVIINYQHLPAIYRYLLTLLSTT